MKKTCEFPPSAFRPLPPPRRCNNGSKSIMLSEEEGFTSRVGDLNYKTRPYYFRRCKRVRPTNIESLPNELMFDILVRLPADYLYDRARVVCCRWYHIIHSHDFINTQIQHSSYGLLLYSYQRSHPIFVTATQGLIEKSEFSYKGTTFFLGSCNGLALEFMRNNGKSVHIINPAIKQPFVLPSFSGHKADPSLCGIGYAAASMEYKVVVTYYNHMSLLGLLILTAGVDKCWRYVRVDHLSKGARFLLSKVPLITEGFMHWTEPCASELLTLDMETEILTVSKIPRPHLIHRVVYKYYFLSTGRSLTLLFNKGNDILELWEMNPETREWTTKVADINLEGKPKQFACGLLKPLGWVKYPEFLALSLSSCKGYTTIFYNLDTHNTTNLPGKGHGAYFHATVHKNSLEWLS